MLNETQIACVAATYDAVLDPSMRIPLLDQFAAAVGAATATAVVVDERHPELQVFSVGSYYPAAEIPAYLETYGGEETAALGTLFQAPIFKWMLDEDAFPQPLEDVPCNRFLAERFGIGRRVTVRVNDAPAWIDAVSLHYPLGRGPITPPEIDFARPLLPHFQRLFALHRPFQMLRARYAAVVAALDRLSLGVAIAAPTGEIILRNREADRILTLKDGLSLTRDQRLRADDLDVTHALDAHLSAAAATASGRGAEAMKRVIIPRQSGSDGFIAEIDALRGARDELEPGLRGALVLLIDPDHRAPVRTDGMRDLYALTPAEADVLAALLDGLGAPDIAEARNTSVNTVRTHLRGLAEKTRTRNRAELVRLALSINPPVERPETVDTWTDGAL